MNEKQQAVGVTTTDYVLYNTDFFFFLIKFDTNQKGGHICMIWCQTFTEELSALSFFQATINLNIGYEASAKASSNRNDQPDGAISHGDAGMIVNPRTAHHGNNRNVAYESNNRNNN